MIFLNYILLTFFVKYTFTLEISTNTNTSELNITTVATATTSVTTTTTDTTTAITSNDKINHLDEIKKLLKIDLIKKCAYDDNPYIIALCPRYGDVLIKELNIDKEKADFLRLMDIEAKLFDNNTVNSLIKTCNYGDWCLNSTQLNIDMFHQYAGSLCLISTCYDDMKDYIENCAISEFTKTFFNLMPLLCKIHMENLTKEYCFEDSYKLLYLTYAMYKSNQVNLINVCGNNNKYSCKSECQLLSKQLNRLESCCYNIDIAKNFKPFNWYFSNKSEIFSNCNLPIKTICWNEGKIYVEVNQTIMYVFIACMFAFFLLTSFFMWYCSRKTTKVRISESNNNLYEYSQLSDNNNNNEFDDDDDDENTYLETSADIDDLQNNDLFNKKFSFTGYSLTDNKSVLETRTLISKH